MKLSNADVTIYSNAVFAVQALHLELAFTNSLSPLGSEVLNVMPYALKVSSQPLLSLLVEDATLDIKIYSSYATQSDKFSGS